MPQMSSSCKTRLEACIKVYGIWMLSLFSVHWKRVMDQQQQHYEQFKGQIRLPKHAVPKRYMLTLKPDLSTCKFTGTVEINVEIVEETKFLILNALKLVVEDGSVCLTTQQQNKQIFPSNVVVDNEDEILVLVFDDVLPLGEGVLGIRFSGILNDHLHGFYRGSYVVNGEKKNMAATQFEAIDARRCFPCWDEPALKATFKITVEVPSELIALSNMPVIEEILDGHLKTVYFKESPIMSTYLVAVVVGLFDHIEDLTYDGIKVCVYCPLGKSDQGKFALYVAVRALDIYKKYFFMPYPLPKLDMVAVPDFSAGAMENYGLITFRDTALLLDDQHSAAANKQWVAIVVAHEVAHQWFGNLVTMEWWTHLWLNEGFATWVSYLATDFLFPEWKVWTQFLGQTVSGLRMDALLESHPIEMEIRHARSVDEAFDAISYEKGASIIRMLQNYLGDAIFQRAVASYINRYACKNAKTEDLWAVLSEESGMSVNMMMDTWTKQKGYPVVYVKSKDQILEFEQSQFVSSGSLGGGQWIVPITLCLGSYNIRKNFLLQTKIGKMDISDLLRSSDGNDSMFEEKNHIELNGIWVKLNVEQTGFFRVKYDDALAAGLRSAIQANHLIATDRFGILDDSYALCEACEQSLSSLLSLMDVYRRELDYLVLSRLIKISSIVATISSDAIPYLLYELKQFFINMLLFSAEKFGWESMPGERHLNALLREELLTALAVFGHDKTRKEALRRFHSFLDDKNTPLLSPDTKKAVYVTVMRSVSSTNRSGMECLLNIYRETDHGQEKARLLRALASCPDPDIVLEVLDFLLSPEVRGQDVIHGLLGLSWEGREVAWKWLNENWDLIITKWGTGLIHYFIRSIIPLFSSNEMADEIEAFFASRVTPSISMTLKQSIERVRINARWVQSVRNEQSLEALVIELACRK